MSGHRLDVVVPAVMDGMRADRAVSLLAEVSRARASALIAGGRVVLDGRLLTSGSTALRTGNVLGIATAREEAPKLAGDGSVELDVVYDDREIVVVDKPAGLVVHPGAGNAEGTLLSGLVARFPDLATTPDLGDPGRPGIVHRLDRGTSGLLVVARTPLAYGSLVAQFTARTVDRRYLALVVGHVAEDEGVVDAPIGRSARTPTLMAVSAHGRPAVTRYTVERRLEGLGGVPEPVETTLLSVRLDTGRTHQIRVHMAAIGHPVVGDVRYADQARGRREGRQTTSAAIGRCLAPGRVFLHAGLLGFAHPGTREHVEWQSPLPADLAQLIDSRSN